jgi:hypothetical protein
VTIISASIPVLRGFTRAVRSKNASEPVSGPYIRTGNSSNAYGRSGRRTRTDEVDDFDGSDASILGPTEGRDGKNSGQAVKDKVIPGPGDADEPGIELESMRPR